MEGQAGRKNWKANQGWLVIYQRSEFEGDLWNACKYSSPVALRLKADLEHKELQRNEHNTYFMRLYFGMVLRE